VPTLTRKRKPVNKTWHKLLMLLPGYDPFAQAGECWFDPDAAERAINFIELLKHVEGAKAGTPFLLEPWQKSIIANLFGWKRPDGTRRYREAFIYVPRKNGKTPLAAAICLYVLFADGEAGAQIYGAAADREQAGYLFRHATGMVSRSPVLSKSCQVYTAAKSIVLNADRASSYLVLSADADTKHGGNSHLVIVDELHAQPNRELVDVLQTSFASSNRRQPLFLAVTTADWLRESICNEKYDQACTVRDNHGDESLPGFDASFLPVIYEASGDDDWKSEETWTKANPNLGVSVSLDYLRRECQLAQEIPAKENTFKRLHLNLRTESDVRAIPADLWNPCGFGAEPLAWRAEMLERMKGRWCTGGLDLASTNDLNALVLLFDEEKPKVALPFFWVTEAAVERRRRQRVPYDVWVRQGLLSVCSGNSTDYDRICADVVKLASQYQLRPAGDLGKEYAGCVMLALDRLFQGQQVENRLRDEGLPPVPFGQGFMSMALPTRRLLEHLAERGIDHGNNPVLAWHAGNASTRTDPAGNFKFDREKSGDKIDGIIGLTMAVGLSEQVEASGPPTVEVW